MVGEDGKFARKVDVSWTNLHEETNVETLEKQLGIGGFIKVGATVKCGSFVGASGGHVSRPASPAKSKQTALCSIGNVRQHLVSVFGVEE